MILGLIGAVLCLTYYYFFFVGVVVLVIDLIVQRMRREVDVGQLRRLAVTFGTIVIATAFYWLPLAISIAGADHPASQANRWFWIPVPCRNCRSWSRRRPGCWH